MTSASETITFGQDQAEPLAERVPEPPGQAPLGALALDAVDVEGDLRAAQPRQEGEERVGGVDEEDRVVAVERRCRARPSPVWRHGLEVLARQPRHETASHAGRQRRSRPSGRGTSRR